MPFILALLGLLSLVGGGFLLIMGSARQPPDVFTIHLGLATMAGGVLWFALSRAIELLGQIARHLRQIAEARGPDDPGTPRA